MIKKLVLLLFAASAVCSAVSPSGWYTDPVKAQRASKAQGAPILVVFAGGTWCDNSADFKRNICSAPDYQRLFRGNCIPLLVELPPAVSWSRDFKQRIKAQYSFLPIDTGVQLPAIYFTDSDLNDLKVREPAHNLRSFRQALIASRSKFEAAKSSRYQNPLAIETETPRSSVVPQAATRRKEKRRQPEAAAKKQSTAKQFSKLTARDQMQEAQRQRRANPNPKADPPEGWFTDPEKAKEFAAKRNLPIMILFSGTDWCPPCRRLRSSVLDKKNVAKLVTEKCVALYVHVGGGEWKKIRAQYPFWRGGGVPSFVFTDAEFNVIRGVRVSRSYAGLKNAIKAASKNLK